ncbi:MAG: zf-HC2 domain-containing protein [Deltaproteobacteria bacterium]|nr:MAG: zf-HC2 domain-containing protein [Deltaproteobacteria bacterium]
MKCKKTKLLLSEYLEDELGRKEMVRVDDHIKHCPRCREEMSEVKNLEEKIKDSLDFRGMALSPQFEMKLRSRIKTLESEKPGFAIPRWAFVSGMAGILLVSLIVLLNYPDRSPSEGFNKTIARLPLQELEAMDNTLSEPEEPSWEAVDFTFEDILRTVLKDYSPESNETAILEDEFLGEMLEGLSPAEEQEIFKAVKNKLKV